MALAWIATFATALCFGVSAILEDLAAKQTPTARLSTTRAILEITTRRWYLLGMALGLLGWLLSLLALQRLPVFAVQAVGAASIGVVVLLHWALTRVPVPRRQAALLVTLAAGLVALAVAAKPGGPESVSGWFDASIWIGIGIMTVVGVLAFRVHGDRGAAILGAVSGLAYGGTALCARALETDHTLRGVLLDPLLLALLPLAGLGIAFFASALQRGSVAVAAACQRASTTIVPAAVGLALLGDEARAGLAPLAYAGFVVTVASVLGLTLLRPVVPPAHASPSGPKVLLQK
jgi:hypothetical protein